MKNILFILFIVVANLLSGTAQTTAKAKVVKAKDRVVLAYVTLGLNNLPDVRYITHINAAFATIKPTFDGINVPNPKYLHKIVGLKAQSPNLKVLLSIGGWTAGGFSEMASDPKTRAAFVQSCYETVKEFRLDGIDLDWEYPTSSEAGIKSMPEDKENFTLLVKELRAKLGKKKLLTLATAANAEYYDFPNVMKYCDFVNMMAYDLGRPPLHHNAALFKSPMVLLSIQESIDKHLAAGIPAHRLVLGLPLYGHGNVEKGVSDYVSFKDMHLYAIYTQIWDEDAQAPYMVDSEGDMMITYDDERSIKLKCDYALSRGLRGNMYWEYSCDSEDLQLVKVVYEATMKY